MEPRLTPELVLGAYRNGVFPMADEDGEIGWFFPDPRAIFPLDAFHTPRSVRKIVRASKFQVTVNNDFSGVIAGCADRSEGTWISPTIARLYTQLHDSGSAHSIECWHDGELAGGLYGVAIGGAFFGESMFTRVTDASKVALVCLVERLRDRGYELLDTQWTTPHLRRFGAIEIPAAEYLQRLARALQRPCRFDDD